MEPKNKKKKTYLCKFKTEWKSEYPVLEVWGDPNSFFCVPCQKTLKCSGQGLKDVTDHIGTPGHKSSVKAKSNSRTIDFPSSSSNIKESVIRAEVIHTNFIVQHNLSFLTADHLSPLYQKMFPDSKIAKEFSCCRTKTTCILNQAIAPLLKEDLVAYMQNNIFGFLNDGSSDTGLKKMNSMCTLIFDVNRSNKVELKFYDIRSTTEEDASKASTLFESIEKAMGRDDIPWENVVSIGLDNCSTNMGKRNSIKSRFLEKNVACFIAGCNCHLAHLAAASGGKAFKDKTGFNVEDHQVDIYYFFKGSTRRKGILTEYLESTGIEWETFT